MVPSHYFINRIAQIRVCIIYISNFLLVVTFYKTRQEYTAQIVICLGFNIYIQRDYRIVNKVKRSQ